MAASFRFIVFELQYVPSIHRRPCNAITSAIHLIKQTTDTPSAQLTNQANRRLRAAVRSGACAGGREGGRTGGTVTLGDWWMQSGGFNWGVVGWGPSLAIQHRRMTKALHTTKEEEKERLIKGISRIVCNR